MAIQFFKLASSSPSITDDNFYYTVTAAITVASGASFQLSRTNWSTGSGGTPASFPSVSNGYYNMVVNGVLQQSIFYSVNTASNIHLLNPGTGSYTIPQSAPITLGLAKIDQTVVVP
ncbi:MAG: DUF4183 domain-containing protein [Oscillospiraceae bacterium]|jgi:hypothetical protein|nr:DUF4183 domain-containing protein [Oscillospiraceae bacterium]